MIIIDAAAGRTPKVDQAAQAALSALQDKFDRGDKAQRQRAAEDVEAIVGPAVRGMLSSQLSGLNLSNEDLSALTTEAVQKALRESGNTRFRRQDIVPEELLQQMRTTARGQMLWNLLSPSLRQALARVRWIKSDLGLALSDELGHLLTIPDLAAKLGIQSDVAPKMRDRTAQNASLLHTLFPNAIAAVSMPERNLVGYISRFVVPAMKKRVLKETGKVTDPELAKARRILSPAIENLRAKTGEFPTAADAFGEYKKRLQARYGPIVAWWNEQISRAQPNNAFRVKDPGSYRDAKELLKSRGSDPNQWAPNGPYHLPKEALKPYSLPTVKKVLDDMTVPASSSADRMVSFTPAAQQQEIPDWAPLYRGTGTRERVQSAVIDRIYPPGSAYELERRISLFNLDHPAANPADIQRLVASLPPDLQEDLQSAGGYEIVARETDRRLREALTSEELRQEVAGELGLTSQAVVDNAVERIRRAIFVRNTKRIVMAARGFTTDRPMCRATTETCKGREDRSTAGEMTFLVRHLPGFYAEVHLGPGATLDDALTWALRYAEKGSPCWIPVTPNSEHGILVHTDGSIELADRPKGGIRVRLSPESPSLLLPVGE